MGPRRLPKKPSWTTKTQQNEGLKSNQEQISSLNNVAMITCPQNFNPCDNNLDSGTVEDKRHPEKVQGTSEPCFSCTYVPQSASKGGDHSTSTWYDRCKNMLQGKLKAMSTKKPENKDLSRKKKPENKDLSRKKKPENKDLSNEKQHEKMEESEFCPSFTFVPKKQEKKKKAVMQNSNALLNGKEHEEMEEQVFGPNVTFVPKKQKKKTAAMQKPDWTPYFSKEGKMWSPIRRPKALYLPTAILNGVSGEDKHDEQFKRPLSCKTEQKLFIEVPKDAEDQVIMQWQKYKRVGEGIQSDYVHDEKEKNVPEEVEFQERCRKMVYDNLEDIRRKEYVKDMLEEEKIYKELAKQEFAQKLLDKQEREKKVKMQKSLTDAWDAQVEYKQQKMEMDEVRKQPSYSLMESERLDRMEEIEKKEKQRKFHTEDETEQNMRDQMIAQCEMYQSVSESKLDCIQHKTKLRLPEKFSSLEECKKIVYDNLKDLKRKEVANYSLLEEKRCKERAKLQLAQMLKEEQEKEKKANMRRSLTDSWDAQIRYKQQKKREIAEIERQQMAAIMESDRLHQTDISFKHQYNQQNERAERQGFLPRSDRLQNKTKKHMDNPDVMQWEMHHSVTEQGRDFQYEPGFLDHESNCGIPDKDRSREICKKIVYDQLSLIKKEEANKRAFMENKLSREMKQREFAKQKREKLEKEEKAAAAKSLLDSWDSQIRYKQQQKKKLFEIERKDILSLIELERECESQKIKRTQLQKHKQAVYHEVQETLAEARLGRSCSKSYVRRLEYSADKHDGTKTRNVCRTLLSRQKVSNTNPIRFPSLNSNSVHLPENCQQQFALSNESDINADLKTRQFPSIHSPK